MTGFLGNLPLSDLGLHLMSELLNMDPKQVRIYLILFLLSLIIFDLFSLRWIANYCYSGTGSSLANGGITSTNSGRPDAHF
jgi:hypothetical protein